MKTVFMALLVIGLLGCETLPTTSSSEGVNAGNIYNVCLPIEAKAARERKEGNPEVVAHFICSIFRGACKDEPTGETCQKGIRKYSGKMK